MEFAAGQFAGQPQHERDGQLGHGHSVRSRRIHHHNAPPRGGSGVDIVHAHARTANHAEPGRFRHQRIVNLHRAAHHQRIGIGQSRRQSIRQLVVRQNFPSRLGRKYGQCCRGNLLCQNNLHRVSLAVLRGFILVKADALLLAQQIEDPHHSRMRLALAPLVLGDRVGVHAQPLGHLVLKEIELLPRDQQLFSKTQFGHESAPNFWLLASS